MLHVSCKLALSSLVLSGILSAAIPPTFGNEIDSQLGPIVITNYELVAADVNLDGKMDVVGISDVYGICTVLGNGDGTFQKPTVRANCTVSINTSTGFTVGDINQDGIPDVVNSGFSASNQAQLQVLLGRGDGTFQATPPVNTSSCAAESVIRIADYNHDGIPDLIGVGNPAGGCIGLSLTPGLGGGAFGPTEKDFHNFYPFGLGDFNGDGLLDIAVAPVGLLVGTGGGHFQYSPVVFAPAGRSHPSDAFAVDFNGDGKLDFVFPSATATQGDILNVNLGKGDGTFEHSVITVLHPYFYNVATTADFNGDGCADILLYEVSDNKLVLDFALGNPDGTATEYQVPFPQDKLDLGLVAADFNGDGKPDIVYSGKTDSQDVLAAFLNTTP